MALVSIIGTPHKGDTRVTYTYSSTQESHPQRRSLHPICGFSAKMALNPFKTLFLAIPVQPHRNALRIGSKGRSSWAPPPE